MASKTTNYELWMPDSTDAFDEFLEEFNENMETIDDNLGGGGGGSGGHTIIDENGQTMPTESKLQFTGNVSVTDDNVNGATVVDVSGGGNVYGAFIDTNRVIATATFTSETSYTATEDCAVRYNIAINTNTTGNVYIDGVSIVSFYASNIVQPAGVIYVKKGQTVTFKPTFSNASSSYRVNGLTQGTNGIFTPIIYSDTERVVGVWRDNKPLYQKTIDCGLVPNDTNWHDVPHGISNLEHSVSVDAIAFNIDGMHDEEIPVPSTRPQTNTSIVAFRNGSNIRFMNTWQQANATRLYVTIRYTKTTDVAGSGDYNTYGVPTVHYSTNEQVVGTWIDGKPLYERTAVVQQATTAVATLWTDTSVVVKNYNGFFKQHTGDNTLSLYSRQWDSAYRASLAGVGNNSTYNVYADIEMGTGRSGLWDLYLTVQYTKTTD